MNEEKISLLAEQLIGLKQFEWVRVKQVVDMYFSSKAAKVELDDFVELKRRIEIEFNLRQFG